MKNDEERKQLYHFHAALVSADQVDYLKSVYVSKVKKAPALLFAA